MGEVGGIPYFSNPNVEYMGHPTGIDGQSDNARVARLNAPIAAELRSSVPLVMPPSIGPSRLMTSSMIAGCIKLDWTDLATDKNSEENIQVERSIDGVDFIFLAERPREQLFSGSFSDCGSSSHATRYYRVRAVNWRGASDYSNVAIGTVRSSNVEIEPVGFPPVAPTELKVTNLSSTQIRLDWADNSVDELEFWIEALGMNEGTLTPEFFQLESTSPNTTSHTISVSPTATTYTFRVRAMNRFGLSDPSNSVSVTTLGTDTLPPLKVQ